MMADAFFRLPSSQKKLFIKAWLMFLIWDWRISKQPYQKWKGHIFTPDQFQSTNTPVPESFISVVEKAGRHHIRKMNCLRRCLVTMSLLNDLQIYPGLHFGVRVTAGKTEAHCWLTHDGIIINDSHDVVSTYTELRTKKGSEQAFLSALT